MILKEEDLKERIESPLNLLNRLKDTTTSISKKRGANIIPALPPSSEDLIGDLDEKLDLFTAKSKASRLMTSAIEQLQNKLDEVKPEKLSRIAADMTRVISSSAVRNNTNEVKAAQIIVYAPQIISEEKFDVVDVSAVDG